MQRLIGLFTLFVVLMGVSGCSYLFYPRAGDYATQAKGASGVETMINNHYYDGGNGNQGQRRERLRYRLR